MTNVSARAHAQEGDAPPVDARKPAPPDTVWLVPDIDFDRSVIQQYLIRKYRDLPKEMIVSQINMQALPHLPAMKIVVLVRRQVDDFTPLSPAFNVEHDPLKGGLRSTPVKPETCIHEVTESKPVKVGEHINVMPGQIFRPQETDLNPLVNVLCELAAPCRVTPQCKPDFMLRMVWAG
jgi:hypothetical protein